MHKMKNSILIKALFALVNILIAAMLIYLELSGIIIYEVFLALIFLQLIVCAFFLGLYFVYKRAQDLAVKLGFEHITGYFNQQRIEGHYKGHWFQIHFASKDTGEQWGMPRTYVKLQYKQKKEFDSKVLARYENQQVKGNRIISVTHIVRDYKNYLLMKRAWFTFEKKKVTELMDLLIQIAEKSETQP